MGKQYITAKEISETLGISLGKAYAIIRDLNEELKSKGFLTLAGKVSRTFFNEKWYGAKENYEMAMSCTGATERSS